MISTFITRYLTLGLVTIILAISAYGFIQKTRYERAVHSLEVYKAEVNKLAITQQIKNADMQAKEAQLTRDVIKTHTKDTANLDRDKLIKELKDDKILNDYKLNSLRNRVQLESNRSSSTMPEIPITTERTTAEWKNSYRVLSEACELTTIDYNSLHDAWDVACAVYECN